MLHVVLVRHRAGAGLAWEIFLWSYFFMHFKDFVYTGVIRHEVCI